MTPIMTSDPTYLPRALLQVRFIHVGPSRPWRAAEDDLNLVRATIVEQLDGRAFVRREYFAVDFYCDDATADTEWIVHGNLIT